MSPELEPERRTVVLLTCEHGGNDVPPGYEHLFREAGPALDSHRGHDIGALGVAERMARLLSAPLIASTVTRLLVDLNRSVDQPDLFSEFTRTLPRNDRTRVIAEFHEPHRERVRRSVSETIGSGDRVLHVGVHSCADLLHGQRRDLDIALLFDESRSAELALCERWRESLQRESRSLRCPFNEPYRGSDDGLTTTLRAAYRPEDYLGIEVEVRQGTVAERDAQDGVGALLASSLRAAVPLPHSRGID